MLKNFAPLFLAIVLAVGCGGKGSPQVQPACGDHGEACCEADACHSGLRCSSSNLCVLGEPLGIGQDCVTDGDCKDDSCEAFGDRQVCLTGCSSSVSCKLPGWICDMGTQRCSCVPATESCNQSDDDCNGIVDDAESANADCEARMTGSSCVTGSCTCPVTQCGTSCTDLKNDPKHCGSCDNACNDGELCLVGICEKPSCKSGLQCNGESCCTSLPVPGGTFLMGRSLTGSDAYPDAFWKNDVPEHEVVVSAYSLDKYEVTVGRMRVFVETYDAWRAVGHPSLGEGAHPLIAGSGWSDVWSLPEDAAALRQSLKCSWYTQTWTDVAGARENQPVECVSWPVAFAFCLWDAGRLPTEAEWEFAAAGGSENRLFPWGSQGSESSQCPVTRAVCDCTASVDFCVADDYLPVGSKPLGNGRYGHADMAGNVSERTLDGYAADWYSNGGATCRDCANLNWSGEVVVKGGYVPSGTDALRGAYRFGNLREANAAAAIGLRCARPAR